MTVSLCVRVCLCVTELPHKNTCIYIDTWMYVCMYPAKQMSDVRHVCSKSNVFSDTSVRSSSDFGTNCFKGFFLLNSFSAKKKMNGTLVSLFERFFLQIHCSEINARWLTCLWGKMCLPISFQER